MLMTILGTITISIMLDGAVLRDGGDAIVALQHDGQDAVRRFW